MTHVSKSSTDPKVEKQMDKLFSSLLENASPGVRSSIIHELLTPTERTMLTKRLLLVSLIERGIPTHVIAKHLKVSPSTVARFENRLQSGSFKKTRSWLKNTVVHNKMAHLLVNLGSLPFEVLSKSHGQFLRE